MEAFSLLKYWRTTALPRSAAKTIVTAAAVTGCSSDDDVGCEDGPYFDLEFTLPAEDDESKPSENEPKVQPESEPESGSDSEDPSDQETVEEEEEVFVVSPSDELFFKGDLVPIEPEQEQEQEEGNKLSVTNLLKPATKFRVLLLKLKKSKQGNGVNCDKAEKDGKVKRSGKLFTLKFKVEEAPPLVSLFSRDHSSKEKNGGGGKEIKEESDDQIQRRFVVMQKYLKMVKPLYGRVSKMKKLSKGVSNGVAAEKVGGDGVKQAGTVNLQGGLRVVRKQLGKSRSAVASVPAPLKVSSSNRRDDSLLQVQDGIQGAIQHCKKSFNVATEVESSATMLSRSVSDASCEKSLVTPKLSSAPPL